MGVGDFTETKTDAANLMQPFYSRQYIRYILLVLKGHCRILSYRKRHVEIEANPRRFLLAFNDKLCRVNLNSWEREFRIQVYHVSSYCNES